MFWAEWLDTLQKLKGLGEDTVMVTLTQVRGHAPQQAGVKLLVTEKATYHTLGGGYMEHHAIQQARKLLQQEQALPVTETLRLTQKETPAHNVQCCGGEVTLTYEVVRFQRPTVAIYGLGHVGKALAHHLNRLPIDLVLTDSRTDQLPELPAERARVHLQQAPIPEATVLDLPFKSLVLILTHDHATDLALLEMALQRPDFAYLGVIGSAIKKGHFRHQLLQAGHTEEDLDRITSPIGLPGLNSKDPEVIALSVCAQLLQVLASSGQLQ